MNSRKRIWVSFLFTALLITVPAYAESLKVCYDASFIFKIGESCISYELVKDNVLRLESAQHTTGLIDLAHHIEQKVTAEMRLDPVSSLYLFFYEKNTRKSMTHHYFFSDKITYAGNSFRFKDSRYRNTRKDFERRDVLDPSAAVMFVQLNDLTKPEGAVTSFFEGKYINITYKKAGYEDIEFKGEKFRCRMMDFKVPASTSSVVTPTGVWRVYVDERTGMIMRLELKFPLGNARLTPVSITGDRDILRRYISAGS